MCENFSPETVLVRFGGDEFAAFHPKRLDREYIERTFSILQEKYCDFIGTNYIASNSSLSIGCITGSRKTNYDNLYKQADVLMYEIKMNGKHGCIIDERD